MEAASFSDLVVVENGRALLPPEVHPLPNLLEMSADEVLESFRTSQRQDFARVVGEAETAGSPLRLVFARLRDVVPPDNPFHRLPLFRRGGLEAMFLDLHDHVISHPVWRHPFFVRVFEGRMDLPQARTFARQYFNQIKNTRQCVAMAIGRFHSLMALPYGPLNERVSEITQVALAQLVADEYGVGCHGIDDYPELTGVLTSRTHVAIYRQFFAGLGIGPADEDEPMLPGVADNVLTQRLVAGHPAFTPVEALGSVGLGMEWGVPEFFSLLLGGLIRVARAEGMPLTRHHLEVFIAHVRYDVLHAVSVMLVTALHMRRAEDLAAVKGACNALMAARFAMMTDLYRHVFGEPCTSLSDLSLEGRHRLGDERYARALVEARASVPPEKIIPGAAYGEEWAVPFAAP